MRTLATQSRTATCRSASSRTLPRAFATSARGWGSPLWRFLYQCDSSLVFIPFLSAVFVSSCCFFLEPIASCFGPARVVIVSVVVWPPRGHPCAFSSVSSWMLVAWRTQLCFGSCRQSSESSCLGLIAIYVRTSPPLSEEEIESSLTLGSIFCHQFTHVFLTRPFFSWPQDNTESQRPLQLATSLLHFFCCFSVENSAGHVLKHGCATASLCFSFWVFSIKHCDPS